MTAANETLSPYYLSYTVMISNENMINTQSRIKYSTLIILEYLVMPTSHHFTSLLVFVQKYNNVFSVVVTIIVVQLLTIITRCNIAVL